jgi:hypothetical protein
VISKVEGNLEYILDATCELFRIYTGCRCSASIKVICAVSDDYDLERANLKTVVRDPHSQAERGDDDGTIYNVHDNTAFEEIILYQKEYFASDDLIKLYEDNKYSNKHRGWHRFYNSTLVVGIPALQSTEFGTNIAGLFFVDSLRGKLDNPTCRHFMMELAWRLAVMLYRMERLKRELSPLLRGGRDA